MKKKLLSTVLFLFAIVGSLCFVACSSNDNEDDTTPNPSLASMEVNVNFELSESWYKYFDIEMTVNLGDIEETIAITKNGGFKEPLRKVLTQKTTVVSLVAKPKANVPAFDEKNQFSQNCIFKLEGKYKDGQTTSLSNHTSIKSSTIGADKMKEYTRKEYSLASLIYTPKN